MVWTYSPMLRAPSVEPSHHGPHDGRSLLPSGAAWFLGSPHRIATRTLQPRGRDASRRNDLQVQAHQQPKRSADAGHQSRARTASNTSPSFNAEYALDRRNRFRSRFQSGRIWPMTSTSPRGSGSNVGKGVIASPWKVADDRLSGQQTGARRNAHQPSQPDRPQRVQ